MEELYPCSQRAQGELNRKGRELRKIKLRGERGIYWEEKEKNRMRQIVFHIKEARKNFFNGGEEGKVRGKK